MQFQLLVLHTICSSKTLLASTLLFCDSLDQTGRFTRLRATVEILSNSSELVSVSGRKSFDSTMSKPANARRERM